MFKKFLSLTLCVLSANVLISSALMSNAEAVEIDPTKPLASAVIDAESVKQNLVLQSIMKTGGKRKAIINNKTMKMGDRIGEFTITNISQKSVTLKNSEETIELALFTQALIK